MKKTYITPDLKIVNVRLQAMMAGSPGLTGTYTSGGTILSRDANAWDEDEE